MRLAVRKHPVGRIVAVECRIGARADALQRQRRATDDRRARQVRQRPSRRTVVAMGVRAQDGDDPATADRADQRLDMLG